MADWSLPNAPSGRGDRGRRQESNEQPMRRAAFFHCLSNSSRLSSTGPPPVAKRARVLPPNRSSRFRPGSLAQGVDPVDEDLGLGRKAPDIKGRGDDHHVVLGQFPARRGPRRRPGCSRTDRCYGTCRTPGSRSPWPAAWWRRSRPPRPRPGGPPPWPQWPRPGCCPLAGGCLGRIRSWYCSWLVSQMNEAPRKERPAVVRQSKTRAAPSPVQGLSSLPPPS